MKGERRALGLFLLVIVQAWACAAVQEVKCGVIIAGGTTAALAAALSSASEGVITCLLEPTDWVGYVKKRKKNTKRNKENIVAGGITAAALSSASEGVLTCLLEPTDWVGYERKEEKDRKK